MIKTSTYTKYRICCPKCGGDIKIEHFRREIRGHVPVKATDDNPFRYLENCGYETLTSEVPTCQKCRQRYEVSINTDLMIITIKEADL